MTVTDMSPEALLERARIELGNLADRDAAFRALCALQGLSVLGTEARLTEFHDQPTALPRIVFEAVLHHVIGIDTN